MGSTSHYLFLGNDDMLDIYPNNKPTNFTVELPQTLYLDGNWECAICELKYIPIREYNTLRFFYLCSDICEQSIAGKKIVPILRQCVCYKDSEIIDERFEHLFYLPVTRDQIRHLTIYLRDEFLNVIPNEIKTLRCTLHLRKK